MLYSGTGGYLLLRHQDAAQRALVFEDAASDKHKVLLGLPWPGTLVALNCGRLRQRDGPGSTTSIVDRRLSTTYTCVCVMGGRVR